MFGGFADKEAGDDRAGASDRRYGSLESAAVANAMVGGDNAARAVPIGLILGAFGGIGSVPKHWLEGLSARKHIQELLATMPLSAPPPPAAGDVWDQASR